MKIKPSGEHILFAATLLAALGWVASKQVIQEMPSAHFIGLRFLLASFILFPICYKSIIATSKVYIGKALGVGCVLATSLLIWVYAISVTETLGEGAFIMSLAMLLAPLIAWPLYKQPPSRAFWFALPVAIAGMMLLSLSDGWQVANSQLYFLTSALLLSLHFNLNKQLTNNIKPLALVCIQLFATGLCALVFSMFTEEWAGGYSSYTWMWFGISVCIATSLRYVFQTIGQKHVNTATASVIMILEPVWTLLLGIFALGEQLSAQKLIGCGVIFLSLILYRKLATR